MNTTELYVLGELAEAAYAPFVYKGVLKTGVDDVRNILRGLTPDGQADSDNTMAFSATQAQLFTQNWQVLAHQPDTGSGFSATLFKNQESGELVYAIRGTESFTRDLLATDIGDIVLDGLAIHQIVDLYNDWQRLTAGTGPYGIMRLEEVPYDPLAWAAELNLPEPLVAYSYIQLQKRMLETGQYVLDGPTGRLYRLVADSSDHYYAADDPRRQGLGLVSATTPVTAVGHSLGGHLAYAHSRLFGSEALGINAAGVTQGEVQDLNVSNLFRLLGGADQFDAANIHVHGEAGPELVSQDDGPILFQDATQAPLFTESGLRYFLGHGVAQMTDTLAVADLFIGLSPELQTLDADAALARISQLLEAGSLNPAASLEMAMVHLARLFGIEQSAAEIGSVDREHLFQMLLTLKQDPLYLSVAEQGVDFQLLDADAGTLAADARTDPAVRYALVTLTPFMLTGPGAGDVYAFFEDRLELFDPDLKQGGMTDRYLEDRAAMLAEMVRQNMDGSINGDSSIQYQDLATQTWVRVWDGSQSTVWPYVVFGDAQDNRLQGGQDADALYGGAGDDLLDGGAGADYLEGGEGVDAYLVGDGDVILDTDGRGQVVFGGVALDGGLRDGSSGDWQSADGQVSYQLADGVLTVTLDGQTLEIRHFASGDLGIELGTQPGDPEIEQSFAGDGWTQGTGWLQLYIDDSLYLDARSLSPNNDELVLPSTWSEPELVYGGDGDDRMQAAGMMDTLGGEAGQDTLMGGEGSDALYGGPGDDRLYARDDDPGLLASLFDPSATGNDATRDFLQGGEGDDALYGSGGSNFMDGGGGDDLIVAGGGNDFIFGDALWMLQPDVARAADYQDTDGQWLDRRGWYEDQFNWTASLTATGLELSPHLVDASADFGFSNGLPIEFHGNDVIHAGAGDDLVLAGGGNDIVLGGDGLDHVRGGEGHDRLLGGAGDDTLVGDERSADTAGNDTLMGEAGADRLQGGIGDDHLDGGTDDDLLLGDDDSNGSRHGADSLHGGEGNDELHGQGGDDFLLGGIGNDLLIGDDAPSGLAAEWHGNDSLEGGEGEDQLWGNGGDDVLLGGTGRDLLHGDDTDLEGAAHGNDWLDGGADDDTLIGEGGNDRLIGGDGLDVLHGDAVGLDGVFHGSDHLSGGSGDDRLFGFGADDLLEGGAGDDELVGDEINLAEEWHGNDQLYGGDGHDRLHGLGGDDLLVGEEGNDSLYGGGRAGSAEWRPGR